MKSTTHAKGRKLSKQAVGYDSISSRSVFMEPLPLLPTTVIGSYATPGWLWTAMEEIKQGKYGATDIKETYDDAVRIAIADQEKAGVDIISDGEMRRFFFVQNFYRRMGGLQELEPFRKTGLYAYDSVPRYIPVEKITVPDGLGIVEEFKFLKESTNKRNSGCNKICY